MANLKDLAPDLQTKEPLKEGNPVSPKKKAVGKKRRAWLADGSEESKALIKLSQTQDHPENHQVAAGVTTSRHHGGNDNTTEKSSQGPVMEAQDGTVIYEIDPYSIHRWSGKDRPENELGDIEDLAKGFKQIGQQVPCIVRPLKQSSEEYELIVGECRWHAAKLAKMKLKTTIQNIDDRMAALIQAVENEKRNDLSEFAKGMSYAKKIDSGILKQKDLTDILGISKQQVSRLLSFNKIPTSLFEAIDDFRKVSARTAEELSRLSGKGEEYIKVLIELAPRIKTGKFGGNRIIKEVTKAVRPPITKITSNQKICDKDGRHLFTWRLDNNSSPSIHFPKDIIQLLDNETINFDQITQEFKKCLAKKLSDLKK